ncbi:metalloregulator ArsR/SmtB family transcription factor [Fluviicola taffensis]|uniref:ArsR/SmtB family transcription factor n=1 Tax=Fluviicola taffensis TaxID=191579 RepID=UPI0031383AFC
MNQVEIFKALSNQARLQILEWLKKPEVNFPGQAEYGDGVCVQLIHQKCGFTQSTVSEHLSMLQRAGLVQSTRKGQWTYYKRNEETFSLLSNFIQSEL